MIILTPSSSYSLDKSERKRHTYKFTTMRTVNVVITLKAGGQLMRMLVCIFFGKHADTQWEEDAGTVV